VLGVVVDVLLLLLLQVEAGVLCGQVRVGGRIAAVVVVGRPLHRHVDAVVVVSIVGECPRREVELAAHSSHAFGGYACILWGRWGGSGEEARQT
jgi:hypothetical protein